MSQSIIEELSFRAEMSADEALGVEDSEALFCVRIIAELRRLQTLLDKSEAERERLSKLINNPHTEHFLEAVKLEAAHQQERWSSDHDAGKDDTDWFWLLGYLAGKAVRPDSSHEKKLHHIITTAAACLNWHGRASGVHSGDEMAVRQPKEAL